MADGDAVEVPLAVKTSDLPARVASAIVMLTVAGAAWWFGGWFWRALVGTVAIGVLWEWSALAFAIASRAISRAAWLVAGLAYIGFAAVVLVFARDLTIFGVEAGSGITLALVGMVIGVDIGAYAFGRMLGGPKIAPRISPSKTWAGLLGGVIGAGAVLAAFNLDDDWTAAELIPTALIGGGFVAIVAQAGDFFESWMKRRAGVKDSGSLIPGHGGLFDRVDGLLAVCFAVGVFGLFDWASG